MVAATCSVCSCYTVSRRCLLGACLCSLRCWHTSRMTKLAAAAMQMAHVVIASHRQQQYEGPQMRSKPTTLQDHSSRLIGIHHLLHDRLEDAPELAIRQASIKWNVECVPLAMTKTDFCQVPCAREEEMAVSVKADSHHPACRIQLSDANRLAQQRTVQCSIANENSQQCTAR